MSWFKIRGIELKFHWSTLIIILLVGFYAGNFYMNISGDTNLGIVFLVGAINGLIILFSIMVHELAHSLYAKSKGLEINEIEFYMFGGASKIEEEPKNPSIEMKMAGIGPLSSLIIGAVLVTVLNLPALFGGFSYGPILEVTFLYSGISNIGLGIFNSLPAFPMDGGRVLRAYLWKKRGNLISATETASKVGTYFGYGLSAYGFLQMFLLGFTGGLWLVVIGMFLAQSAKQSYQQTVYEVKLSKIQAEHIASEPKSAIPSEINVNEAIQDYFLKYKSSMFPVVRNSRVEGILDIATVKDVPMSQRSERKVGDVMNKLNHYPIIDKGDTGKEALSKLKDGDEREPIVIVKDKKDDEFLGFIGKQEISSALKMSDLFFDSD